MASVKGAARRRIAMVAVAAIGVPVMGAGPVAADTLEWALAEAYVNNPTLNDARAATRALDEGVPLALSGYRPTVALTATVGTQNQKTWSKSFPGGNIGTPVSGPNSPGTGAVYSSAEATSAPHSVQLSMRQTLFNGFLTASQTRQAEAQVSGGRAQLAVTEEQVLLNAATAYMNLLRDGAILDLQRRNVDVLQEQLRQTRDRFNVGEVTRTDVAQAESRLAAGRSQVLTAEANYVQSKAIYRQTIGVDPGTLAAATPVDRLSPHNLNDAIAAGRELNPAVAAAMFGIDAQVLQVKIKEAALAPVLTATAQAQGAWETNIPTIMKQFNASLVGQLTVPIYQGGGEYASVRGAKETLGQKRIDLEIARDQVQSNVVQSWGQLEAAKAQIQATQAQVNAAEIALNGVREEARVGQRTTLDVLNAQQELVNARVALVTAQRDRVVASYTLLSTVGGLYAVTLGLKVPVYDPMTHYQQVRDNWAGLRTPDGR